MVRGIASRLCARRFLSNGEHSGVLFRSKLLPPPAGLPAHLTKQPTRGSSSSSTTTTAALPSVGTLAPPAATTPSPAHSPPSWTDRFRLVSPVVQFRETRQKLCREFLAGGLLYVEAGEAPPRNGTDVFHRHRSHSHFVYVTGVELPGYAALLDAETGHYTLLAPRLAPEAAYWVGAVPSLDQLQEQYGADSVCYLDELSGLLAGRAPRDLHTLPGMEEKLRGQVPPGWRVTSDLLPATLERCRGTKTDAEVGCLLAANVASGAAHMDMWRACRPGLREYQLEAVFSMSSRCRGASAPGYPPIVGSGPNAAIMHYEAADGLVAAGHLVLVDAGAEVRCYTADISRTFPASGRFEGAARDLYGTVLAAQHAALAVMAGGGGGDGGAEEGVSLQDADRAARRVLLEGLRGMGLVRGASTGSSSGDWLDAALDLKLDRVFMPHGLGHHLGLDVHDVSDSGPVPKGPLRPGHVVTVEPGAYLIPPLLAKARDDPRVAPFLSFDLTEALVREGLGGVRIEDNVVMLGREAGGVQERGQGGEPGLQGRLFNLTVAAGVVKEMDEVEEVMRQEWQSQSAMLM